MKYRVLGTLAVSMDGQHQTRLGGRMQRLVLALLLANANRVLSQEAMVEAVWDGEPPEKGARTLHTYLSNLRRIVGDDITREGNGYILRAADGAVDSREFERLLAAARSAAEGDPESAANLLTEALSLWTGSPFGDLEFEQALVPEANRLNEVRIDAQEMRAEVDLRLGRHQGILQDLQALVQDHPYRERLAGLLMLALYRCGRQAEALRVFSQSRERLAEELGIDPSTELQELELRILNQDPTLAAAAQATSGAVPTRSARGYELHEHLGTTRFGRRYRGFQSSIGREVAVLVMDGPQTATPQFVRRFESEMQAVARLEHPHLVSVFDYWREPTSANVVTPFFRGGTLGVALENGPLGLTAALRVADQVSAALAYLHRTGWFHGALSAEAVLLDEEQNAYLADTGMESLASSDAGSKSADVYSLGALVFHMLTGQRPDGKSSLRSARSELPADLDHALSRALHPDSQSRYETVEDLVRALRSGAGLDVVTASAAHTEKVAGRNPYRGLRAFQEADAADFHGRDRLIAELVEATSRSRIVAVVGPSGSGKSSAVRAGLIPRLRSGAVAGSEKWLITDMYPGTHPFEELEKALTRVAMRRPPRLHDVLAFDPRGLVRAIKEIGSEDGDEVLIVIDQFEELFSLVASPSDRRRFLDLLVAAADEVDSRARVVLTLRADFFDQPLRYPEFAQVLRGNVVTVSPPTADGLARAVSQPALDSGVALEPGLVNRVVDDVRNEPGGLPLLQYALTELYASRQGDMLTLAAYEQTGGVAGAVARRAEEIYGDLGPHGKEAARQLFLRLVTVDEFADDTRRRVLQTELMSLDVDRGVMGSMTQSFGRAVMGSVIQSFGSFRLLSFDQDAASRTPTVELAHEALLREWDRLGAWVAGRREDLLLHRRLTVLVRDWHASGLDPGFLLRGARLEQALGWQERTDMAVSAAEADFLEASAQVEEAERAVRAELEAKAARRRTMAIGVLAAGLLVATVLGIYALIQRREAVESAALASARELSLASVGVAEDDPELALLLALEAIESVESAGAAPLPEVLSALWGAYTNHRVEVTIPGAGFLAAEFSPDGEILATDMESDRAVVVLWDQATGAEVGRLQADGEAAGNVTALAFSGDGSQVLVARNSRGADAAQVDVVDVFDLDTRQKVGAFRGPPGDYGELDVSPTGHVAAWDGEQSYVWAAGTSTRPFVIDQDASEFLPDENLVFGLRDAADLMSPVVAVDWRTGFEALEWDLTVGPAMRLSPDGSRALVVHRDERVGVYDLETREPGFVPRGFPDPQSVSWSPDGSLFAVSGNDADITIADAQTGEVVMVLSGHDASVWATAWHPSGERLASVEYDNEDTRIWNVSRAGFDAKGFMPVEGFGLLDMLPSGSGFLRSVANQRADVLDLSGNTSASYDLPPAFPVLATMSGDETTLASMDAAGAGVIVDLETGETTTLPRCQIPLALSEDGAFAVVGRWPSPECAEADVFSGVMVISTGTPLIDHTEPNVFLGAFSGSETFDGQEYVALVLPTSDQTGTEPSQLEVWSIDPLERVLVINDTLIDNAFIFPRFSYDGRYLGVGSNGGTGMVIDIQRVVADAGPAEFVLFNQEGHSGNVPRAISSTDGIVATAGFDGFYRLWDLHSGSRLLEINVGDAVSLPSFGFSPDGSTFYYMHTDNIIARVPTDPEELVELARSSVTRALTEDECRDFLHADGCP